MIFGDMDRYFFTFMAVFFYFEFENTFFSEMEAAQSAKIAEITKVAETKTVRFLETFAIWVFFRRIDGLAENGFIFIQTI